MDKQDRFKSLCVFDPRNLFNCIDEDDSPRDSERKDVCYCDNCFYGRDKLANEILRLMEKNKN